MWIWEGSQWWIDVAFFYLSLASSPYSIQSFYTSALTSNSLTFCRVGTCASTIFFRYQPIGLMTTMAGLYAIRSNSSLDTVGFLFDTAVIQIADGSEAIRSNDDDGGDSQFLILMSLQAMFNYTLVVTTYNPNVTGPFLVSAGGNASVTFFALWFWFTQSLIIDRLQCPSCW